MNVRSSRLNSGDKPRGPRLWWAVPLAVFLMERPCAAQPRIACDRPACDFGVVTNKEDFEHTFVIRNEGDSALVIQRVRTGCECLAGSLEKRVLAPRGEAKFAARYLLKGYGGRVRKSVFLHSNDPQNPVFLLSVEAEVARDVELRPWAVDFGQIMTGTATQATVEIRSDTGKPFLVSAVETNRGRFFTADLNVVEERRKYVLNVKVGAEALRTPGSYEGETTLVTDSPLYARIRIPVTAIARKELAVMPPELVLAKDVDPANPPPLLLNVYSLRDRPFQLLGGGIPGVDRKIRTEPVKIGRQWQLRILGFAPWRGLQGRVFRVSAKNADGEGEDVDIPIRLE